VKGHNGQTTTERPRARKYTCSRCDVQWYAREDERVPDTCWSCERNDMTTVHEQAGRAVRYYAQEVGL
jgi:hypothetical protein